MVQVFLWGIIADESSHGYSQSSVVFIEWLMSSERWICVFRLGSCVLLYTKNVLLAMDPDLDNCLIILPSVTFGLFLHYLVTKKKKGGGHLSVQTYYGCQSTLMHLYCWSKYTCCDHFCTHMSDFICTMRRKVHFVLIFIEA